MSHKMSSQLIYKRFWSSRKSRDTIHRKLNHY